MSEERLALGRWGEEQAVRFLRRQGMKILERNYRTPVGEVDIIARQGKNLIFVEVKTRSGVAYGLPQEAVGRAKQRQIARTAQWYLGESKADRLQPRFDVVAVLRRGTEVCVEHIPEAFSL
jgi:putative endonuclease